MNTEKKTKVKKVLKIAGTCLGATMVTGIASLISYKLGKKSIDREQIEAEFVARTVSEQYNGTNERYYAVGNCNGEVYAKWDISKTKPEDLNEYNKLPTKWVYLETPIK